MIGQSVGSDASRLSCFLFRPRKSREKCRKRSHTNVSNASVIWASRIFQAPLQTPLPCFHASINEYYTAKNGLGTIVPRLLSQVKVGTHLGSLRKIAHSGSQGETGAVSDGGAITTLGTFRTFTNIPGPGVRTANFAAFGSWLGVLTKNAESLRDSDALMRVAVPRRRGPAGLRDLFRFCQNCDFCALRTVETPDSRLSKGLICRFLRLPSSTPCAVTFSANTQISLSAISVANTFALWYDKS